MLLTPINTHVKANMLKYYKLSQVYIIPVLWKLKQKDQKLENSRGYIENLRLAQAGQGTLSQHI